MSAYFNRGIGTGIHIGPIDLYAHWRDVESTMVGMWITDHFNVELWASPPGISVRKLKG